MPRPSGSSSGRPLQRVSSLVLNRPNIDSTRSPASNSAVTHSLERKPSRETEYIPDSEEEYEASRPSHRWAEHIDSLRKHTAAPKRKQANLAELDVIEISSESDAPNGTPLKGSLHQSRAIRDLSHADTFNAKIPGAWIVDQPTPLLKPDDEKSIKGGSVRTPSARDDDDPFISKVPGAWVATPAAAVAQPDTDQEDDEIFVTPARKGKTSARARRIVWTSSEEETEPETDPESASPAKDKGKGKAVAIADEPYVPLYADDDGTRNVNDGSVLTFEGKKKPVRRKDLTPRTPAKPRKSIDDLEGELTFVSDPGILELDPEPEPGTGEIPARLPGQAVEPTSQSDTEDETDDEGAVPPPKSATSGRPAGTAPKGSTRIGGRQAKAPATLAKGKRISKKALEEAARQHREAYSQQLFAELNESVFKGKLPDDTPLLWNPRLTTTAGKASWHRDRNGVETSKIQLSPKILDCDERIDNTLAHEMCHLACWVIDREPGEGHGKFWSAWVRRVERARPDIEINTRHNYEINYPYKWECEKCATIYGRFRNSIKTDEYRCGGCIDGQLIPLFATRPPRTPRNVAHSRNAALNSRESPLSVVRNSPNVDVQGSPLRPRKTAHAATTSATKLKDSDPVDEVEKLTQTMAVIEISD